MKNASLSRMSHAASAAALTLVLAAGVGLVADRPAHAQSDPPTQSAANGSDTVSLEGVVREMFRNRFILESGGNRFLVEPIGTADVFALVSGDRVTVVGRRIDTLMQATRVLRANGEVLHDSAPSLPAAMDAPPSQARAHTPLPQDATRASQSRAIADTLASLGLQPIGEAVRKRHHTEILARMADGRSVYVSFDLAGRLWEIEDADHDKERTLRQSQLSEQELFRAVRDAGFSPVAVVERKKRHAVVSARNRAGEVLELHVDLAGYIYKQVWPR